MKMTPEDLRSKLTLADVAATAFAAIAWYGLERLRALRWAMDVDAERDELVAAGLMVPRSWVGPDVVAAGADPQQLYYEHDAWRYGASDWYGPSAIW